MCNPPELVSSAKDEQTATRVRAEFKEVGLAFHHDHAPSHTSDLVFCVSHQLAFLWLTGYIIPYYTIMFSPLNAESSDLWSQ